MECPGVEPAVHAVYVFDAATGALKARVGNFENVVIHLTFSPDGHFLAATLGGGKGLRVIDTKRMSEVAADRDYGVDSFGAAFAPDGRLFTVAYDGQIRSPRTRHAIHRLTDL